jgi:hypothetical protein
MTALDCTRLTELLSDLHEGTLDQVLQADAEEHLQSCAECRALREALSEVLRILRPSPAIGPAADLATRAAEAALRAGRPRWTRFRPSWTPSLVVPTHIQLLAAGLAIVVTGGVLMASGHGGSVPAPRRMVTRVVNTGVYLIEKKDRVVEDIRILRVVIATAFEGRLDRMNDRVDDYRKLMERRRLQEQNRQDGKKSKAGMQEPSVPDELAQI